MKKIFTLLTLSLLILNTSLIAQVELGCTDSEASNYDPDAIEDDGSCVYCDSNFVTAVLISDIYSNEMSWTITNDSDEIILQGEGNPDGNGSMVDPIVTVGCLEDGCYTMNMYDSSGDGWNIDGTGGLILSIGSQQVIAGSINDEFGALQFGVNSTDCVDNTGEILGCMDSEAVNYNELATIDDGTCLFFEDSECLPEFIVYDIDIANNNITIINATEGENVSFFWDFGDGTSSTDPFPTHVYEEEGTYTICLTVTNPDLDCTDEFCADISFSFFDNIEEGSNISTEVVDGFTINIISPQEVSISEQESIELSIFPNPTSNYLTIRTNSFDSKSIQIFDLAGKLIYSKETTNSQLSVSVEKFNSGLYILKVQSNKGAFTERFEVKK